MLFYSCFHKKALLIGFLLDFHYFSLLRISGWCSTCPIMEGKNYFLFENYTIIIVADTSSMKTQIRNICSNCLVFLLPSSEHNGRKLYWLKIIGVILSTSLIDIELKFIKFYKGFVKITFLVMVVQYKFLGSKLLVLVSSSQKVGRWGSCTFPVVQCSLIQIMQTLAYIMSCR